MSQDCCKNFHFPGLVCLWWDFQLCVKTQTLYNYTLPKIMLTFCVLLVRNHVWLSGELKYTNFLQGLSKLIMCGSHGNFRHSFSPGSLMCALRGTYSCLQEVQSRVHLILRECDSIIWTKFRNVTKTDLNCILSLCP